MGECHIIISGVVILYLKGLGIFQIIYNRFCNLLKNNLLDIISVSKILLLLLFSLELRRGPRNLLTLIFMKNTRFFIV